MDAVMPGSSAQGMVDLESDVRDGDADMAQPVRGDWLMTMAQRVKSRGMKTAVGVQELLIVEDDENNSDLLQSLLTFNNVSSSVAKNATEAMVYCQTNIPMAILMDIGLPDTNGLELTHMLKNMPDMEMVPIIAVSAHASERMKDLAEEAGCSGFISKPWNPEEIMETVQNICETA